MLRRSLLVLAAELGVIGIGASGIGAWSACAAPVVEQAARSPTQLRDAVAESMRRANAAKGNDRVAAVKSLLDVYRELGPDVQLPAKERLRLEAQVRTRLQRFAAQFQYETAHNNSRGSDARSDAARSSASQASSGQVSNSIASIASNSQSGAAGGPAVEGLDSLIEVIQTTTGQPDDWDTLMQAGNGPAPAGGVGVGFGGAGRVEAAAEPLGGNDALNKGAEANGADLVDLIQTTIDPPSWDVNGGPGSIMYFNNFRALVVRTTGEGQEDVGGLLGGLRRP